MAKKSIKTRFGNVSTIVNRGDETKPAVLYHHGLFGTNQSVLAQKIEKFTQINNYTFVSFNNLDSPLTACDDEIVTPDNMMHVAQDIYRGTLQEQASDIILVGNSFGGHVAFKAFQDTPVNVRSYLGLNAAPNILTTGLEPRLNAMLSMERHAALKEKFDAGSVIHVPFPDGQNHAISKAFMDSAHASQINDNDTLYCHKAVLLLGRQDPIVSLHDTNEFMNHFQAQHVRTTLVNDDHSLAHSGSDIAKSFGEIIAVPTIA